MNAGGFSRFAWPSKTFDFPIDERLDPVLFELGFSALGFLDQSLDGLRLSHDDPAYASRILLIYLASRIYGATAAALMLLAHELGREAIMAGRTQYECYIKMLYYDHFHDKATATLENIDAYNFKFGKRLGVDPSSVYSQEELDALEELARRTDLNFRNQVVDVLSQDENLRESADSGNPFARWFLNNANSSYGFYYVYGSTLVHATPVDLQNVIVGSPDSYAITVDSRMHAANVTAIDLIQRCFSATGFVRWRFGLEFSEAHTTWAQHFENAAQPHQGEHFAFGSMHD